MTLMRNFLACGVAVAALLAADRPWQQLSAPTASDVAARFLAPPAEYSPTCWWGWDGPMNERVITRDLDGFLARGVRAVTIEPGYKMDNAPYLSPAWFQLIRTAVQAARKRDMRVWLVDEGKYPSGFAGGKFAAEHPELGMQALVVTERIPVAAGETLQRKLAPETVGALALNLQDNTSRRIELGSGELNWLAPEGKWQVLLVEHRFRSAPTRSVNNPTKGKDEKASLMDYLDPAATHQFLAYTHEQYAKVVGDEFGKTILGFRGDEPDYSVSGIPWTPAIFDEFQHRKGYDVRPYAASFLGPTLTEEERRAKADYWDVWSALFRDAFFQPQAEWCARHSMEYLVHLNHEEAMPQLVRSEGDFFRAMRYVQLPGIDTIWNQIWPGKIADFPKYASSAAHIFGRPRAFTESFAGYNPAPTLDQARWVLNQQFVRGINMVELMFTPSSAAGAPFAMHGWMGDQGFPGFAAWTGRAAYLLSMGRPTAQIAVYHPTMSMWLGDPTATQANQTTLAVMQQLLEQQRDFDLVDDDSIAQSLTLDKGVLRSLSGNEYRAVIVPGATAISRAAFDRLRAFAKSGGHVVLIGKVPSMVVEASFLKPAPLRDYAWVTTEPAVKLTPAVVAALPAPDVAFSPGLPAVKCLHRRWRDADCYFFFNESPQPQSVGATVSGSGPAQTWNAATGEISNLIANSAGKGAVRLHLNLAPNESRFVVVGASETAEAR
jgi:hypothetical protein